MADLFQGIFIDLANPNMRPPPRPGGAPQIQYLRIQLSQRGLPVTTDTKYHDYGEFSGVRVGQSQISEERYNIVLNHHGGRQCFPTVTSYIAMLTM